MAKTALTPDVKAALAAASVLIALGCAVEELGYVVIPLVYLCVAFAMSRMPLRYSLFGLMFLGLTLENPAESFACGLWQSPLYPVGALLLNHMNVYTGIKPLIFSGMDLCLFTLAAIALSRRRSKRNLDSPGHVQVPLPMIKLAQLSFVGIGWCLMIGVVNGGQFNFALWQVDRLIYLPLVFLLCCAGLRGPRTISHC